MHTIIDYSQVTAIRFNSMTIHFQTIGTGFETMKAHFKIIASNF